MKEKQKLNKKRKKEAAKKLKVRNRRDAIQKKKKYDKAVDKDVNTSREKLNPIVNTVRMRQRVLDRLESNLQVLKALEDEYKKEMESKRMRNEELEEGGHNTFREKMDEINKMAMEDLDYIKQMEITEEAKVLSEQIGQEPMVKFKGKLEEADTVNTCTGRVYPEEVLTRNIEATEKETQSKVEPCQVQKKTKFKGEADCTAHDIEGKVIHGTKENKDAR